MRRLILFVALALCYMLDIQAQTQFNERPKLVVGIVVDQMRWDYLGRYYDQFQEDGFKRLINQGYRFKIMPIEMMFLVCFGRNTASLIRFLST